MKKPLPRTSPITAGVDPAAVTAFVDAIEQDKLELHGFMVLRHGQVAAEGAWKPYSPDKPHMLFSLSKSFTSTAVGFAVTEGLLSVDDPVLKFFPGEAPEQPGRHWSELRVRHLLSMSTGHAKDTTGFMVNRKDGDWVKGFLWQPLKYKPGTHFLYNTGATYMLSVIVQKLTGQRVLDYLTPRLFKPLGIEGAAWQQCPRGYDTGGFGLSLKTEDIARFGQFLLQRGMWEGRQLIPAAWIDEATCKQVENGNVPDSDWGVGYGYQFWRCVPGCYRGDGAFGQYCVVIPEKDAVVAITSGLGDMGAVLKHIWDILLPGMKDGLATGPQAQEAMAARLGALHYDPPAAGRSSPLESALIGRKYKLDSNPDRRKAISFAFGRDDCEVTIVTGRGRKFGFTGGEPIRAGQFVTRFGRGAWAESTVDTPNGPSHVAASFTWEGDSALLLTVRILGTPFVLSERIAFNGDELDIRQSQNVGFNETQDRVVKGKL